MGQVDLVAIAGLDVALHLVERRLVVLGFQVTGHGGQQVEVAMTGAVGRFEQGDQALALIACQAWVEHQLAGCQRVVGYQCPVVQAKLRIG
ncbi:hypothetical protein D3C76_1490900 [compost metagenome]